MIYVYVYIYIYCVCVYIFTLPIMFTSSLQMSKFSIYFGGSICFFPAEFCCYQ